MPIVFYLLYHPPTSNIALWITNWTIQMYVGKGACSSCATEYVAPRQRSSAIFSNSSPFSSMEFGTKIKYEHIKFCLREKTLKINLGPINFSKIQWKSLWKIKVNIFSYKIEIGIDLSSFKCWKSSWWTNLGVVCNLFPINVKYRVCYHINTWKIFMKST